MTATQTSKLLFLFFDKGVSTILVTNKPDNILGEPEKHNATKNTRLLQENIKRESLLLRLRVPAFCDNIQSREYLVNNLLIILTCKKDGYIWVFVLNQVIPGPNNNVDAATKVG
jgi:hypothetical protein